MERLACHRIDVAMACVSPPQMPVAARFGFGFFQESLGKCQRLLAWIHHARYKVVILVQNLHLMNYH